MINPQSEFWSCRLIETFSAKEAMPEQPALLDDPVEAVGVMRAEDIPGSLIRGGIRFGFFHHTLLSGPRQNVDLSHEKQILQAVQPQEYVTARES
jgi:hypothetical protein